MTRIAIIASLVVLASVVLYWQSAFEFEDETRSNRLFADFSLEQLNQVDLVSLSRGDDEKLEIKRTDGPDSRWVEWVVPRYMGGREHIADRDKLFKVLYAMLEATLVEQKTSRPALYQRLGVQDPTGPEAGNVLLEVRTSGGGEWKLIVGNKSGEIGRGRYVRKPEEAASWLINRDMDLPVNAREWLDAGIINVPPEKIRKIVVNNPRAADKPVTLTRKAEGGDFIQESSAGNGGSASQAIANRLASVIENLRFKEVYERGGPYEAPEGKTIRAIYTMFDGWEAVVDCYKAQEKENTFFMVEARGGEGAGAAADKVERLNAKLGHWAYNVPEFLFDDLDVTAEETAGARKIEPAEEIKEEGSQ